MSKISVMPHDGLFKKFLGDIDIARDFLRLHLPVAVREVCDFSTMKTESCSFIEDDLRQHCSDMLYSVHTTQGTGYIYTLVEHQSSHQKNMAFRLLRYSLAAMQRHLDQGHKVLPLVVPVLLYQGEKSPYPYSLNWLDCFPDRALAEQVYLQPFPLVDLTVIPDETLLTHQRVALLELVLKHVRARDDFLQFAEMMGQLLNQYPLRDELFSALMYYLCQEAEVSDSHQFLETLATHAEDYREEIMTTIAQELKKEGLQEGMQQGIQQAAVKFARRLLAEGKGIVEIQRYTGLSAEEIEKLSH